MDLTEIQRQTIIASLSNGLGLTQAAKGLQIPIDELSTFIKNNPAFHKSLTDAIAKGYQYILSNINQAAIRKHWNNWQYSKTQLLSSFILQVTLWEQHFRKDEWSPGNFMQAFKLSKTLEETATAMGLTEKEMLAKIYADKNIMLYLMENGINP